MRMMGYNDGGDINIPDSCNSWKLRLLFPRTLSSVNITSTSTTPPLPGSVLFALNHHVGTSTISDQGIREFNTQPVVVSSRWNPTPVQLRILEELYRRGTKTPSAEQIQSITAQLRRYGKIEGKNVFYWFQNHKARERQKRRRQMESASDHHDQNRDMEILEGKESEVMTGFEGEQTKNWIPSTNCSTPSQDQTVSIPTTALNTAMAECRTDGLIHFEEGELQLRKNIMERNSTWKMIRASCPSHTQLINTSSSVAGAATTSKAMATTPSAAIRKMEARVISKAYELSISSMAPHVENEHGLIKHFGNTSVAIEENWCGESHTLQLFPLRSGRDGEQSTGEKETEISSVANSAITANLSPCQFFEFLPLKD